MPYLVTWNMQGSNASTDCKWQTGVANLMTRCDVSILCLQECGAPPPSATPQGNLANNARYNLYHWGGTSSRPGSGRKYISYYHADVNGNRCNLAIVSKSEPTDWHCSFPRDGPNRRPVIGAQINGNWYFCLHAISPGGADVYGLLSSAAFGTAGAPWFTAGDFNREPEPPLGIGTVCLPNANTHPTNDPRNRYDYMYSSGAEIRGEIVGGLEHLSDHLAVKYRIP